MGSRGLKEGVNITMNFEIENGIVYRIDEGETYWSKIFYDYEHKLVTEITAIQEGINVRIEGFVYKQKYDSTLIEITNNINLVIGDNPLNTVELIPTLEGLIEINLVFENTMLESMPEFSFSDGIVTSVWRYE